MKQIFINILLIHIIVMTGAQKFAQNQILIPTPSSSLSPDRTIYLPADTQTPLPHYSVNNMNKINYQFLPPSQNIAPSHFPTPLSIILSSTFRPNLNGDGDDDDDQYDISHHSLKPSFTLRDHNNRTLTNKDRKSLERNDNVPSLRMYNLQPQGEKGRPNQVNKETSTNFPAVQNAAARRMIITREIQKSDPVPDQIKSGSFQNSQYIQASSHIVSTTVPAIPIIRLSNEMDLDGSFSYEALGADQTHYVQNSRMENMGTDKEEQVVEGSYSYVGDDGRTYTVHYIADSNGYRASGDHLPSPPPVPEIIQRAVQYNLAEEARKPPHMRNVWENEENYDANKEESKHNFYSLPPPINLHTGKTPEPFSFLDSSIPKTNQVTSRSSFHPAKPYNENRATEQIKSNTPLAPQITFLASQGAHNPSSQQQSQSTLQKQAHSDKLPLPQLVNYEADKDLEQEGTRPLWRWQYGYNAHENQIPNKKLISRSFTEGDDVIINFSDMTPEQYTRMIQTQISAQTTAESNKIEGDNTRSYLPNNSSINDSGIFSGSQTYNPKPVTMINYINRNEPMLLSTPKYDFYDQEPNKYSVAQENNGINQYLESRADIPAVKTEYPDLRSTIMSMQNFAPENQLVTQSYNFEETRFDPIKRTINNKSSTGNPNLENKMELLQKNEYSQAPYEQISTPLSTLFTNIYVTPYNYYQISEPSSFKPSKKENKPEIFIQETTTTESSIEQMFRENFFLKKLFQTPNLKETSKPEISQREENNQFKFNNPEVTSDSPTKVIEITQNPVNEGRLTNEKPLNVNDIFHYVVMKNHFESTKTKPKSKSTHFIQYNNLNGKENNVHYIPVIQENNKNQDDISRKESKEYTNVNHQQQQELHGLIKNYKVLQRQKNTGPRTPLNEPQRHIKTFHSPGLPPLGRAGPSMKTYFPPTLQI